MLFVRIYPWGLREIMQTPYKKALSPTPPREWALMASSCGNRTQDLLAVSRQRYFLRHCVPIKCFIKRHILHCILWPYGCTVRVCTAQCTAGQGFHPNVFSIHGRQLRSTDALGCPHDLLQHFFFLSLLSERMNCRQTGKGERDGERHSERSPCSGPEPATSWSAPWPGLLGNQAPCFWLVSL